MIFTLAYMCACRLDFNSIGSEGAIALATSLGSLTSLKRLSYVASGIVWQAAGSWETFCSLDHCVVWCFVS